MAHLHFGKAGGLSSASKPIPASGKQAGELFSRRLL